MGSQEFARPMKDHEKVNILLVDDQPAKLLSYEVILEELGENLIKATSATMTKNQHCLSRRGKSG